MLCVVKKFLLIAINIELSGKCCCVFKEKISKVGGIGSFTVKHFLLNRAGSYG